jgi:hypothetical protein
LQTSTIFPPSPVWRGAERRTLTPDLNPELLPDGQAGPVNFKVKAAVCQERRGLINRLLNHRYAWRGYQEVQLPSDPSVHRFTLSALQVDTVIGTITVGFDGAERLSAETAFGDEIQALRRDGFKLCEFTRLAIDPSAGSKRVLAALFHVAYIVAHRMRGHDTLLMEVNPRHQRYYERMLGCQVMGDERINTSVNAPAVLMGTAFSLIRQRIARFGGQPALAAQERSLYPFAFSASQEQAIMDTMLARQRLAARRITDTGHPDGNPFDFTSVDLLADPGRPAPAPQTIATSAPAWAVPGRPDSVAT